MFRLKFFLILSLFCAPTLAATSQAIAATLTYSFTGTVTTADANAGVKSGDPFTGQFSYDLASPEGQPTGYVDTKNYQGSPANSLQVTANGITTFADPSTLVVQILDSQPGGFGDYFYMYGSLIFKLYDYSGTVFNSKALPGSLNLSDFDIADFFKSTSTSGAADSFTGTFTSLTQVVPEPSTFALLAIGLLGICITRLRWPAICIVALCVVSPATAAALNVDEFSATGTGTTPVAGWPATLNASQSVIFGAETSAAGAIQNARGRVINRGSDPFGTSASATYNLNIAGGYLDYQSTPDGSANISLSYGGTVPLTNTPDFDLPYTDGYFTIHFLSVSLPATRAMTILATVLEADPAINGHLGNGTLYDVTTNGPQVITVPVPAIYGTMHSQIDAFIIDFKPPNGAAFQIDSIEFTPVSEPSTFALLAIGGILLHRAHRSRGSAD